MVKATPRQVPPTMADDVAHRRELAVRANGCLPKNGGEMMDAPLTLKSTTVAGLASFPAADWTNSVIYVSDEVGGPILAFSDSVNWRRVTDRAIVA